ncbi:MAG: amidohydrolase family protein [Saprospiraceae bacterium]|nr:amidohydrolase family protein [Saprospiraceae bacterium]
MKIINIILILLFSINSEGQEPPILLTADRVFNGEEMIDNGMVLISDNKIIQVSSDIDPPQGCIRYDYGDATIMPGMIEGHAHMLLHPYDETPWNEQVLNETVAERSIRGAIHAEKTLMAGFTTVRDLGSEGAGYADVGLKQSIEKGVINGPRLIVAGPAIVTTGSYGPKGFREQVKVPLGAHAADGHDDLIKEVRRQIGGGADFIKVYADYRWGPEEDAQPTFTIDELKLIVEITESSGRKVVAHAATAEGIRRATEAGVVSIEHGDGGTPEVFQLMKEKGVALCPTIAAGDAISQYRGWNKRVDPDPERIIRKKASMKSAIESGVIIVAGGDVGVFSHGDNVRELEMMVEYGMTPEEVLKSVTSINADVFGISHQVGRIVEGLEADIIVVKGDPQNNISNLREVKTVIKSGMVYKN